MCEGVWKREQQKPKVTQSKRQEEDSSRVTEQSAYFLRQARARSLFKRGINPGYITNPELNQQWSIIENDRYKLGRSTQASVPEGDDRGNTISLLQNHISAKVFTFTHCTFSCFFFKLADTCAFNHWLNPFYFHVICITKFWSATDGEGVTRRGEWQARSKQTVRQTEAARKHGKGRLTNCFCPLWEGAARHGLVWALTFSRVKSDPRRRRGRRKGDEERVRGMEKGKN